MGQDRDLERAGRAGQVRLAYKRLAAGRRDVPWRREQSPDDLQAGDVWKGVVPGEPETKIRLLEPVECGSTFDGLGRERQMQAWEYEHVPADGAIHRLPREYLAKAHARLVSRLQPEKDLGDDIPF
jgi:hypothetical protein